MIIIGELINSTRPKIKAAIREKDEAYIRKLAKLQAEKGADFLDINSATSLKNETADLQWLLEIIQDEVKIPLSIDTPDPKVMESAVKMCKSPPLINSITNEKKRKELIKIAKEYNAGVIALPLGSKKGMPDSVEERLEEARILITELEIAGIERNKIYLDALILSVGSKPDAGVVALEALRKYREEFPDVKRIAGLTNVSFGLPDRRLLNRVFLSMLIEAGLDAVIIDPVDEDLAQTLRAANVIVGKDKYCREYIKFMRGRK